MDSSPRDLERIRYIAKNYQRLRGLFLPPVAAWMVFLVLITRGLFPNETIYLVAAMVLLVASMPFIDRYYKHRFGHLEPTTEEKRQQRVMGFLPALVIFVLPPLLRVLFGLELDRGFGLAWIVALPLAWRETGRGWYMRLGLVLMTLVGALMAAGMVTISSPSVLFAFVLLAVLMATQGISDHLFLVRNLKGPPKRAHG